MPSSSQTSVGRDVRIDVLRAVAALAVLLFHAQNAWYLGVGGELAPGERLRLRDTWLGLASSPLTLGFLGLNLFFVLSGLCIHASYLALRERGGAFSYGAYAKRRFWRIYPAYAAAIAFSLGCLALAEWIRVERYGAVELSVYAARWVEQTLRYLSFTHTLSIETFGGYNAPLYTMAIEAHFYLAYPAVLAAFRAFGPARTLALSILASLALSAWVLAGGDAAAQRLVLDSILVRWPEWIMGCVIAEFWFRARRGEPVRVFGPGVGIAVAACFIAALAIQVATGIAPNLLWSAAIALIVSTYLLAASARPTGWEHRLAAIGLFSYSIYLLHYPVLRVAALLLPPTRDALALNALAYGAIAALLVVLARGFFTLFERPFLQPRAR
ncbi:MAG: acyltransferase [Pseudomonadota bacterium]